MSQVPPGFKFLPSDKVLLLSYLLPKVKGEPLPCPDVVKEIDLYQMRPDKIWNKFIEGPSFGNSDLFFITKLRLTNKRRCVRTVDEGGTWSQEGYNKVYSGDANRTNIGEKRRFSFKSTEPQQRGGWVMYEYKLNCSVLPSCPHSSYVLCQLRKNIGRKKTRTNCRKRKAQSELQDSHTETVNQPITLVSNSEHKQGEIEIRGAQPQPQTQVQDNPTNLVLPSNIYGDAQDEIERSPCWNDILDFLMVDPGLNQPYDPDISVMVDPGLNQLANHDF